MEIVGGDGQIKAYAAIDNSTSTVDLGTYTNTKKQWFNVPLNGTVGNNIVFGFVGTQSGSNQQGVYGLNWDMIQQPPRTRYHRTEDDNAGINGEKQWDAHFSEIDILGTGTVTCVTFIDTVAVMTGSMVGPTSGKRLFTKAYPIDTYGDIVYSTYTCTSPIEFKLWKDHHNVRPEPPRVTNFVTDREFHENETWYQGHMCTVNCLGSTVLATVFLDEVAIQTNTLMGTGMLGYSFALPSESYGDVMFVKYVSSGGLLKHYKTWYDSKQEPDRLLFSETETEALDTDNYLKTWIPEVNPLGTCTGTLIVDGVAVSTQTMTGIIRKKFELLCPVITTGKTVKAKYSSSSPFKHYGTTWEKTPKPYGKTAWYIEYRKPGGATQLDLPRFFSLDVEGVGTYTLTNTWEIDGSTFATSTLTATNRQWLDVLPFPPGGRGYIFQQKISSTSAFRVWKANLDIERVGIKGLSRTTIAGKPTE
jgi:hypothetical protein